VLGPALVTRPMEMKLPTMPGLDTTGSVLFPLSRNKLRGPHRRLSGAPQAWSATVTSIQVGRNKGVTQPQLSSLSRLPTISR
jgi:hypothetical protein